MYGSACHVVISTSSLTSINLSTNDVKSNTYTLSLDDAMTFQLTHQIDRVDFVFPDITWMTFGSVINVNGTDCCQVQMDPGMVKLKIQ